MKILLTIMAVALFFSGCKPTATEIVDSGAPKMTAGVKEVSPAETQKAVSKMNSQFIDVRTAKEFSGGHAAGAINIPLDSLNTNLSGLEKSEPVYLICETGNRSLSAALILKDAGFNNVLNVSGGTVAWKAANLPMESVSPDVQTSISNKLDEKTYKALLLALEDERRAQATYQAVLNKFPGARPFINIIEAEKTHEALLLPLFAKYSVDVPKNEFDPAKIAVPAGIAESCKVGVTAENENIALYDEFLAFVKESDIKEVFVRLQRASRENHLPAFTRCSEGGLGNGKGRGRPF